MSPRRPWRWLCLLLVLLPHLAEAASDYLPLIPGAVYRYVARYEGRSFDESYVVKQISLGEREAYYFISRDRDRVGSTAAIIGPTMLGLGLYLSDDDAYSTIESFWLREAARAKPAAAQVLFSRPPQKGDRKTLHRSGQDITIEVAGYEDVVVTAGRFKRCLKLQLATDGKTGYAWLAPGVGIVKWLRTTGREDELVAYEIPGRKSVTPAPAAPPSAGASAPAPATAPAAPAPAPAPAERAPPPPAPAPAP